MSVVHEGVSGFFTGTSSVDVLQSISGLPPAHIPYILVTGKVSPRKMLSH